MNDQLILLLETATGSCSVALTENGKIIALKEANERNIHASHITLFNGCRVGSIGFAIQRYAEGLGFGVVRGGGFRYRAGRWRRR